MNIGEKIKTFRLLHKLTQEQLAEMSGLSYISIRKYETGERNPKPDQLLKISDALGISINIFMDFDIRTISDLLSLVFRMDEQIDLQITAEKDSSGFYQPDSIKLSFSNTLVNQKLCMYLSSLDKSAKSDSTSIFAEDLTDLKNLLLDDNTCIAKDVLPSNSSHTHSAATKSAGDSNSVSSSLLTAIPELQELFGDCTASETNLLIKNAQMLKDYIRSISKNL